MEKIFQTIQRRFMFCTEIILFKFLNFQDIAIFILRN